MTIPNVFNDLFSKKYKNFLIRFEQFGTGLALIGTGNKEIKKPEGNPFGRTINNYELWTTLVKNFNLETPYLAAIVDNPADIFVANFYPHNKFIAITPRPLFRPSGESATIFITGTITPSFISIPLDILILKVEL